MRIALLLTATALVFAQAPGRQKRTVTEEEVARVHASTILLDTHNDITSSTVRGTDIGASLPDKHTDIARMKKGGMGAEFFAVYVAASFVKDNHSANRTLQMIDTVKTDIVAKYPNDFMFATTAAEVREARKQGKIAALMGIEGGHAIEDSLRLLRQFHALGIRYMTLTHSNTNSWADSSGDTNKPHGGLTEFGEEVVREMNRLGMIVDISHTSDDTFWDALRVSQAPIFASHSSVRSLASHARNMTDDMIKALGEKGGVIQINFACNYLKDGLARGEKAALSDVVKHIGKVVEIAGVKAVGLGSDFDGVGCVPTDLDSVDKWPNLTRALLEEGYTAEEIRLIYGENTLRVMEEVEKVAAKLTSKPK